MTIRDFESMAGTDLDWQTPLYTVVIAVVAFYLGTMVDKFFAQQDPKLAFVQIALYGVLFHFLRTSLQWPPETWIFFSTSILNGSSTLFPRLKYVLSV